MSFPLVPRGRRVVGLSFGMLRSVRRGAGSDVADSRPYRTGDDIRAIDWAASARLSSARQSDEFVVREHFAEEAPKVVVVVDRRPQMSFFAPPLPWLDKPAAVRQAVQLIGEAASMAGGFVGYLDYADGAPYFEPPRSARRVGELQAERLGATGFTAPADSLERPFLDLAEHRRSLSSGAFVFVLSDFLPPPSENAWLAVREHRWDVVPVVVRDPTWEQSFPDVAGIAVRLRDPGSGRISEVRLRGREVDRRRRANEQALRDLLAQFRALDLDPVVVSASDRAGVLATFLEWAELRRLRRAA